MNGSGISSRSTLSPEEARRLEQIDRLTVAGGGVSALIDMLDDPAWTVRRAVVAALAAAGADAVEPLCQVLRARRDNEARVAAAVDALSASTGDILPALGDLIAEAAPAVLADVAQILGRRRGQNGLPLLVKLAQNPDDNVAVAAIEALGRVGGRGAVEALVNAVGSGIFFRVFPAIDVLGRSGDPRVIAPLTALLEQAQFAPEAARALGRTGDAAAVQPLSRFLGHATGSAVRVAALALADLQRRHTERFGEIDKAARPEPIASPAGDFNTARQLVRALAGADPDEQAAICFVLGALKEPSVVPALAGLLEAEPTVAAAASAALERLGTLADDQVLREIREGDSARRRALLPLVGRIGAAKDVIICLSDPEPEVRALACEAVGRVGFVTGVGEIFPLLADASPRVSFAAMAAIQSLGGTLTETLAIKAAQSPEARVRRAGLKILAYFGFPSALEVFLAALPDTDERVRESAIAGLPFIEDPRALDALLTAAKDPAERTRAAAMRALGQCEGDLKVTAYLLKALGDGDSWVRYYACQALGKLAFEPAAEAIVRLLGDPAGQVRVAAVDALSRLKGERALEALRSAVADAEPDIQRAAIVGLGVAEQQQSLPLILTAAASTDHATRLVALSAVARFKSPAVLQVLGQAAKEQDETVRTAAIGFLSAMPGTDATRMLAGLLADGTWTEQIIKALASNVDGRISGILAVLEGADDETAPSLTSALARMRSPESRAALISTMTMRNVSARKAVASALAAIASNDALAALRIAAETDSDPEVRQICSLLLAR